MRVAQRRDAPENADPSLYLLNSGLQLLPCVKLDQLHANLPLVLEGLRRQQPLSVLASRLGPCLETLRRVVQQRQGLCAGRVASKVLHTTADSVEIPPDGTCQDRKSVGEGKR